MNSGLDKKWNNRTIIYDGNTQIVRGKYQSSSSWNSWKFDP